MTISQRILEVLGKGSEGCFLRLVFSDVDDPIELDYVSLIREAARWLEAYEAAGVPEGGRIVIVLPHSADLYAAFLGALLAHRVPAILAPPSPKLTAEDFESMSRLLFARIDADLVVTDSRLAGGIAELARSHVLTPQDVVFANTPEHLQIDADRGEDQDIAFIQYSSGTTGLKKGTIISHGAILAQVDMYAAAIRANRTDSIVSWLPLYHDMGLVACFLLPLLTGTPVTAMSPFEWIAHPRMLLDVVHRYRSTLMWLPNFAYHVLARAVPPGGTPAWDLSSLRAVVNCSEPIGAAAHAALARALGPSGLRREALKTCYAMAEATFAVTSGGFPEPPLEIRVDPASLARNASVRIGLHRLVSSGRALEGTDIAIGTVDHPLAEDRVGEIWVRSPSLFDGYLFDPETTDAVLHRGWLRTGDLGFLHQGELFVLGRGDDLIIIAGRNFQPQDIEAVVDGIEGAIPGRSVAFSVEATGEGTSYLVVVTESELPEGSSRDALAGRIRHAVATQLDIVPRDVRIVEPRWLKKSTSGKPSRTVNRAAYLARFGTPDREAPTFAIADAQADLSRKELIRNIVCSLIGARSIADDAPLLTSGLVDSLGLVQLLAALEERFGKGVPSPSRVGFAKFDTIAAIDALVADVQTGAAYGVIESGISTRLHKCRFLERGRRDQTLLMLGSSTSHFARTRTATEAGYRAFNFTVGSADPIDFYCLLRFALDRLAVPVQRVVVFLDTFLLKARNDGLAKSKLLEVPELVEFLMDEERMALPRETHDRSVLLGHVKLRLRRMLEWSPVFLHGFDPQTGDIIDFDRALNEQDQPYSGVDPMLRHAEMEATFRDFDRLCPRRLAYLDALMELGVRRRIEVDVVVMPFHASVASRLRELPFYAPRRMDVAGALARYPTAKIHDLSTVEEVGGDPEDFTDPSHPGPVNMARIFGRVLGNRPPSVKPPQHF